MMDVETLVARNNQQLNPDKQRELLALLLSDPLLQDVPREITIEHVDALIARETGRAVNVLLERYDGVTLRACSPAIPVLNDTDIIFLFVALVISNNTTVRDIKNQIKAQIASKLYKEGQGMKKISWYVPIMTPQHGSNVIQEICMEQ